MCGPGPAHFPRCSLYWATAAVGLISLLDAFQRLHDEEAGWQGLMGKGNSTPLPTSSNSMHSLSLSFSLSLSNTHTHTYTQYHHFSFSITKLPVILGCLSPVKNSSLFLYFSVIFLWGVVVFSRWSWVTVGFMYLLSVFCNALLWALSLCYHFTFRSDIFDGLLL